MLITVIHSPASNNDKGLYEQSVTSHTSPVSRSQIMTQYDLGGGAEEPKIVWHHKITETLHNLWLAPEKSSLIQGITLTLLLGDGGGVKKTLRLWNRCDISWTEHLTPDYPANLYLSVGIGFGQIIEEKNWGVTPFQPLKKCPHHDCLWPPFESVPPIKILMFAKNQSSISFSRFTVILS